MIDTLFLVFVILGTGGLVIYFFLPTFETNMINLTGYEQSAYFIKRMTSILWTPVLFGTLMSLSSVYYFYKILNENKPVHYILFIVIYCCLLLSVSRGPILAALIGYGIIFIFNRKWMALLYTSIIIVIFSTIISFYATGNFKFITWICTSTSQTLAMEKGVTRVERWKASDIKLTVKPYGLGLGKAGATAFRFLNNDSTEENKPELDSLTKKLQDTLKTLGDSSIKNAFNHGQIQEGINRIMTATDADWPVWRQKYLTGSINEMKFKVFIETITDVTHAAVGDSYLNYEYPNLPSYLKNKGTHHIKKEDNNSSAAPYSTDGWYLKLANETGLIGLGTYFLLMGFYLFFALRKLLKDSKNIAVLAFAFFVMVNIQNIVCNTLDFYPFIILYWMVIGISVNFFFKSSIEK